MNPQQRHRLLPPGPRRGRARPAIVQDNISGQLVDRGWSPYFSVRYGKTPVYRGPSEERISRAQRRLWEAQAAEVSAIRRSRSEAGLDA